RGRALVRGGPAPPPRSGAEVAVDAPATLTLSLRVNAVRRALTNLVDNARRHAHRGALAAMRQGRMVSVTVDDDGPGIPPERRESVFRPFESDAAGGTGLGLTIARDIVRAHGGDIVLEDSPPGGLPAGGVLPVCRPAVARSNHCAGGFGPALRRSRFALARARVP